MLPNRIRSSPPRRKPGNFPWATTPQRQKPCWRRQVIRWELMASRRKTEARFPHLEIPAGQPLRIEMAESMQQDLRAVGIEMKIRQVEFNKMLSEMVHEPTAWQAILVAENLSAYPSGEDLFVTGGY